jgi:hypothetical protein
MGQGKTRLAVAIASHYRTFDKRRKIIVLLPKSLEGNFKNTIEEYNENITAVDDFKFISLNASNMFKQMSNIDKTDEEIIYEKKLGDFMSDIIKNNSLNNSLLIIDESHNLFNAITNGSKNAMALYDLIMNTTNLKIIFLTGTPIVNDPFELVPCFNMITGRISTNIPGVKIIGSYTSETNKTTNNKTTNNKNKYGKLIRDIVYKKSGFERYPKVDISGGSHEDKFEPVEKSLSAKLTDEMPVIKNEIESHIAAELVSGISKNKKGGDDEDQDVGEASQSETSESEASQSEASQNEASESEANNQEYQHDNQRNENPNYTKRNRDKFNKSKNKKTSNKKNLDELYTTLFSESIEEFEDYFIDKENKTIKNKNKFTNRIFGLSSYFGDLYFPSVEGKPGFPKKLETQVEKIPMSEMQFSRYISARENELEETKKGFRGQNSRFSASSGGSSTYRVKTRQISNYCIPEYALGPVRGNKSRIKYIDRIKDEDLKNTDEYSKKMGKILENISKHTKNDINAGPGLVYSQFVSGEGLGVFSRILDVNGYYNVLKEEKNLSTDNGFDLQTETNKNIKKYAILSGNIDPEVRVKLIETFNKPENADGNLISLLLLSGAVAEGIDLKRIRHVHIMEPFWNFARINQVETRAIRYKSHFDLPIDRQNVQVYIYLSDYPETYPKKKIIESTTDVELYEKSINNMQIINTFLLAIAESSIDCTLHYPSHSSFVKKQINCKLCAPNNKMLFHPLLKKDMELPSNCDPYSEKKIKVKEILLEQTNEKFYYIVTDPIKHDIELFLFNKKINGYMPMPRNYPYYGELMRKIIEQL